MAALATVGDIEARLGRDLTSEEELRIQALLDDASALVRAYTRQTFELVEDDVLVTRPIGTQVRLPQRPVTEVTEVVAVGGEGLPDLPLPLWEWDGIDVVDIGPTDSVVVNLLEWWGFYGPNTYRVTYSHGYAEIPAEVVAVVCAMVLRVLLSPSLVPGMVNERIGQYSYQMQQGTGAIGASVQMLPADKEALSAYRRVSTTTQMRAS